MERMTEIGTTGKDRDIEGSERQETENVAQTN